MWYHNIKENGRAVDMQGFKRIETEQNSEYTVYRLEMPARELGSPVTLISGKQKYLIDCGASPVAVTKIIVPALKSLNISLKQIDYLLFTHCHPEAMGGAHKLKQLAPSIRIAACESQIDKLRNPTYYLTKRWSRFPDYAPPLKEISGVITETEVGSHGFGSLVPIPAPGHDDESVCWYVSDSKLLVCGDAIQGGGAINKGIAVYSDLSAYLATLERIKETDPNVMLCDDNIKDLPGVIIGKEKCMEAIETCYKACDRYTEYVEEYLNNVCGKKSTVDYKEMAERFFTKEVPDYLGFAMITFNAHLNSKIDV